MSAVTPDNYCNPNSIYLSARTLKKLKIDSKRIILHFGRLTKKLNVVINNNLEPGKIIIPRKLSPEITIPNLPYDHYFNEDHLHLGPVIGYMVVPKYFQSPDWLSLRFINYDKIRGLIFLFRPNTINMNNNTISGKYFNPQTKTFIQGTFPYPSVIYNRIPLSRKNYNHLKKHVGDNLFNYPFFNTNKWSFWKWMSKEPSISKHLPQTTEFTGMKSLMTVLNRHKAVYLKPTSLSEGRGIVHVMKSGSNYVLSDRLGNKYSCKTPVQLLLLLEKKLIPNRKYIIQQPIPFITNKGNKIDFRVYIQKDYSGKWKYSGLETKVAKKGSIISNSRNREMVVPGEKALERFFSLDKSGVKQKIKEITRLGIQVLKVMEQRGGHLGDAAVDLVLDKNHKIWLLEVQLNYAADKKTRRSEGEQRVLPFVLPTPLEYAKALAGF